MKNKGVKIAQRLTLLIFLFISNHVLSQSIQGRVFDEYNEPVIGASVMIKNSIKGTVTDINGNFSLNGETGDVLKITYLGFSPQEVEVKDVTRPLSVILKEDVTGLDEIVVVGYGSIEKKKLTSAISSVKSEDFLAGSVKDAGQLIMGKVAGLNISNPSGNPTNGVEIILRGTNSLKSSNTPLILIDGVPGDLQLVSPDNIASIDVLKDGSAGAIYGTRANNGVILITTKQEYSGKTSVTYSGYLSTEQITRTPDILSVDEYRAMMNSGNDYIPVNSDYGASTNWLDEVTRTPLTHYHSVSITGGTAQTNIFANITARMAQGVFLNSDKDDLSGRLTINHSVWDGMLKFNVNAILNKQDYTVTADGDGSFNANVYNMALIANPTAPVKLENGEWSQPQFLGVDMATWSNPASLINERLGNNDNFTGRLYGNITLTPIPELKFNLLMSYQRYNQTRGFSMSSKDISNTVYVESPLFASRAATQREEAMFELTGQYDKTFGKHQLTVLGGYSYMRNSREHFWMNNFGFPSDQLTYHNMGLGSALNDGKANMYSNKTSGNLVGFFGRINYNFSEKYMLTASMRYEGDSKFVGSDQEWGLFPAVSGAWRINKESFMEDVRFIDDLKIRAGYGVTGIAPDEYYQSVYRLKYMGTGQSFYYDGEWVTPLGPANNVNTKFTWEKKHEYNVGLDFSFFKGRLSGSVDYYIRNTVDLLWDFSVPVPPNAYNTTMANIGTIQNKGLEILLTGTPVRTKEFSWTPTVTFSYNTNKLTSLDFEQFGVENPRDYFFTNAEDASYIATHRVKVGDPIGQLWGYKVVDISEAGRWIYDDPNNPGETFTSGDEGITVQSHGQTLGNSLPKYYLGFNNTFTYKNFDLGITMRGAFDYLIINQFRLRYENVSNQRLNNKPRTAFEPVFGKEVNRSTTEMNSHYLEDGDFWKIDNITLGYTKRIKNFKYLNSFRVYGTVNNAFIFTSYTGNDPESASRKGLSPGMDNIRQYPTTRVYTLGVNLKF